MVAAVAPPAEDLELETEPITRARPRKPRPSATPACRRRNTWKVPSTTRKVDHVVTMDGGDSLKMAEKLQTNVIALRFLAALDFDTAVEKAVILDDEEDDAPPPPAQTADPVEIECADVASGRPRNRASTQPDQPRRGRARRVPDLDTAVKAGNVEGMSHIVPADLLEGDWRAAWQVHAAEDSGVVSIINKSRPSTSCMARPAMPWRSP
jgi:hypothetical protein